MKVIFKFQIHSGFGSASSSDIWLSKQIDMPFVPFAKLLVSDEKFECVVNEVAYDHKRREIIAYCGENKELYNAALTNTKGRSLQEISREYLELGWELDEDWEKIRHA